MAKASNLLVRTASGAVLFVVVVGAALLSRYTFAALLAVMLCGCLYEFYKICTLTGSKALRWYGMAVAVVALALNFLVSENIIGAVWLSVLIPLIMVVFIAELYRHSETPVANIAATLTGLVYVALPLSLFTYVASWPAGYNAWMALAVIFTVWANDVGAYLFGITLGRHKLFERHSPKKSWEGFFGGVLCAVGVAVLIGHFLGGNLLMWGGLGLVTSISAVFGDLVESMFKRSAGVKDSGAILPGHGGFLDRFDALLVAIPFIYTYFTIFTV